MALQHVNRGKATKDCNLQRFQWVRTLCRAIMVAILGPNWLVSPSWEHSTVNYDGNVYIGGKLCGKLTLSYASYAWQAGGTTRTTKTS